MKNPFKRKTTWQKKQEAVAPARFYGDGGTIHSSGELDVETFQGTVVAVWFRCQMLPFHQREVDGRRAESMESYIFPENTLPDISGVAVVDKPVEPDTYQGW